MLKGGFAIFLKAKTNDIAGNNGSSSNNSNSSSYNTLTVEIIVTAMIEQ